MIIHEVCFYLILYEWKLNLNRGYKRISSQKKVAIIFYYFSLGLFYNYVYNRISVN